jgi:hypothetical protein
LVLKIPIEHSRHARRRTGTRHLEPTADECSRMSSNLYTFPLRIWPNRCLNGSLPPDIELTIFQDWDRDGGNVECFIYRASQRIDGTTMKPELSLVIPTYNERENVEQILQATVVALECRQFEIIVVDDDSPDRTWEIVEQIAAVMPAIRLVRRMGVRRDQAQALMEGFRVSRGTMLGKMDADGSHDPRALPQLITAIESGFEVAIGSRYASGGSISSWPLHRRVLSRASTAVVQSILRLKLEDPLSGFWLLRREVYEQAARFPMSAGFKVLLQLCVRGHARKIVEVPIHFRDRTRGTTKLRPRVVLQSLVSTISLAAATRHRTAKGRTPVDE